MSPIVRVVMIAVLAGVAASACDDAPAPASDSAGSTPTTTPAKPASGDAQVPANMVSAVSASKTASLIGVHFALESVPAVDKSLTVNLAIVPHREFARLRVLFETPDGVTLISGGRLESPAGVKAESLFSHKLVVEPKQEGVFLITAAVESESDEGTVIRIYSIPIIVYAAQPAPTPAPEPAAAPAD